MPRKSRLIFILALLGLFLLVVVFEVADSVHSAKVPNLRKADAEALGEIDLKDVPHPTFGYLKSTLSPLPVTVGDCRASELTIYRELLNLGHAADQVEYSNCRMASWGHGLVSAIFLNDAGYFAAKNIADVRRPAGIRINSEFRGTLCGKSMREVMDAASACGARVEIATPPNSSSNIYEGLRRDGKDRNIY